MRILLATLIAPLLIVSGLTGCSSASDEGSDGDLVAPVTKTAEELQGAEVRLIVGQALNVDTGSESVDSFEGTVSNADIVEFVAGSEKDGLVTHPGFFAKSLGETPATLSNTEAGAEQIHFTITVADRDE